MIALDIGVSKTDVADMDKAIDLMIKNTGRMGIDAVKRASYHFLVSAKAQTPIARKKNRTLHTKIEDGKKVKFYIARRTIGKPYIAYLPNPSDYKSKVGKAWARAGAADIKARFKPKPRIGAAKTSWSRAFTDIGKTTSYIMKTRNKAVMSASKVTKKTRGFSPSFRIINELNYLEKIAPNLERTAMRSAGKSLLKLVERGIEKQTRKF